MNYEYMPKANNGKMKGICTGLFAGAVVLFGASGLKDVFPMPWLMQFVSICMLTVAIMLMGRYLLRYYLYRVEQTRDGVDFTVDEITRRGRVTVCRLSLGALISISRWDEEHKPPKGKKIYNYCVDARPAESWLLTFADGDDMLYIRFSPDDKMRVMFENAVIGREENVG